MHSYIIRFTDIDKTDLLKVGGKGLNLGMLSKISEIRVPEGFCITTEVFQETLANNLEFELLLEDLKKLKATQRKRISEISGKIRSVIQKVQLPGDIEYEIVKELSNYDKQTAFAVRSSATAEDLPNASFAGQQDTYLNIKDPQEILRYVIRCWSSLFTDRAVIYRIQNGFDHCRVSLSVVVQKMIFSEASGIVFTADPLTSDRSTLSVDAGFGLGEAMVSGLTNPDIYKIRGGKIISKKIRRQDLEICLAENGGIQKKQVDTDRQEKQILSDDQILQLACIGKKIESHFGCPQDIEWCFYKNEFYIVQSRNITTLFPIPVSMDARKPRVYMSIGHIQMMTDIIRPLGMSFFQMISEISLTEAGGRFYADITHDLSSPIGRKRLVMATGKQDLLIQGAIKQLLEQKEFMHSLPKGKRNVKGGIFTPASILETMKISRKNDPEIINELIGKFNSELNKIYHQLSKLSGKAALDFIKNDRGSLLAMAYNPKMLGAIIAAILASDSINKNVEAWIGEKNTANLLSKSLKNNITTEMGLALCNLADRIREHPQVLQYLSKNPTNDDFFEKMCLLPGGKIVEEEFRNFLLKYGMRCPGEIDITRPRFEEKPTQLLPMLLNDIRILKLGEHKTRFSNGKIEAKKKEEELLHRLVELPNGKRKAKKVKKDIRLMRNFIGYREYPKYCIVRRYQIYKRALQKEADRLVEKGVLRARDDIFYLYFDELYKVVETGQVDYSAIDKRRQDYVHFERLNPPRVITSDGFVPSPDFSTEKIPSDALMGIPVSSGVIEGRARVALSVEEVELEAGDILVTRFTDPSWTPLFTTIKGLITEVGGFTTHGAVVAREYGLPAVVGVENAVSLIKDGQRIRVNGTEGYVEIL
ncbi:MAG: phosphoenolpyruvate synthase [Clostridium sp.]|uniref:phosphoenolpyruvate synthase n=1 Tax=Clostridium sp. TaxID=1506 RepID=UPI0025BAE5FD|nr:phosphoenolpyruvate synthase [Clostridium sp.]MCH3963592.1 phosphoenolpyruvate synthase [Clostridium sp.]MCI1714733.1 phosphoenolpyruvate synthase [Clostridium sp.]MCI1799078.1 phosphoenolpyruvate synthase [Clostridium sp.]MCI1812916.1 phosphoenolpyruvate synthase [Clostridium sp.]MCI1869806.1 phosphoenolpyruvate synthase [Clostridium sp.]